MKVIINARGTGFNQRPGGPAGPARQLTFGEQLVYSAEFPRGLRFTVLNGMGVVFDGTFDTWGSPAASGALADEMSVLVKEGTFGVLTSFDAWETSVTPALIEAFEGFGLMQAVSAVNRGGTRSPYAAIFTPGFAREELQGTASFAPPAVVEVVAEADGADLRIPRNLNPLLVVAAAAAGVGVLTLVSRRR